MPAARFAPLTASFHHFQRSPNSGRTRERQLSAHRCASLAGSPALGPKTQLWGTGWGCRAAPSVAPEARDLPAGVSVPPPCAAVRSAPGSPPRCAPAGIGGLLSPGEREAGPTAPAPDAAHSGEATSRCARSDSRRGCRCVREHPPLLLPGADFGDARGWELGPGQGKQPPCWGSWIGHAALSRGFLPVDLEVSGERSQRAQHMALV